VLEQMESPATASKECMDWLEMMANEHMCNREGVYTGDGGEDQEEDDDNEDTDNLNLLVSEARRTQAELNAGQVNTCYQEWLSSAVAAKVKEFLEAEL